jgi:AcrR family transcriptional regulator
MGEVIGRRERKKQRTREEILRAGLELFLAQGFAETTVAQIAAAADVAQSTFFLHFSSKEELVLAGHGMGARAIVAMLHAPREAGLVDVLRTGVSQGLRPSEWDAELWELRAQVIASDPGLAGLERIRFADVVRPHLIEAFAAELGAAAEAPEAHLLAALVIGGWMESARLDAAPDREAARARYFGRLFDALEAAVGLCRVDGSGAVQ